MGGTSHAGKSSLGKALATRLGWDLLSTDQFARHPGRPWRNDETAVPSDVVDYFSNFDDLSLLNDVLSHYRDNIWPIVRALVLSRVNNSFDASVVIEGSALLPDLVAEVASEAVKPLWLLGDAPLIGRRIREESSFSTRSQTERNLIDTFARRSVAFDTELRLHLGKCAFPVVHASNAEPISELLQRALAEMKIY